MSDQQEFGWLDEILEQHYWDISSDGWKKADIKAKAAIQARFTAQAKQHQAELLQARKEATEANNDLHKRHEDNLTAVHQIELLRARIESLNSLLPEFEMVPMISGWKPFPWATMKPEDQKEAKEWQTIHSHAAMHYQQFVEDQIAQLQAELDKLEGGA